MRREPPSCVCENTLIVPFTNLPQPHAEQSLRQSKEYGSSRLLDLTAEQRIRSERHFHTYTSTLLLFVIVLEQTRSGLSQFKNPLLTNRDTETDSALPQDSHSSCHARECVRVHTCPATISVNWWFCDTAAVFFFSSSLKLTWNNGIA